MTKSKKMDKNSQKEWNGQTTTNLHRHLHSLITISILERTSSAYATQNTRTHRDSANSLVPMSTEIFRAFFPCIWLIWDGEKTNSSHTESHKQVLIPLNKYLADRYLRWVQSRTWDLPLGATMSNCSVLLFLCRCPSFIQSWVLISHLNSYRLELESINQNKRQFKQICLYTI